MYLNLTSIVFNELGFTQGGQATVNSSAYPGTQSLASISFPNVPVLLDFFMIYYSPITNNVAAVEGALSFCGQTYNTSVQNGQVSTVVIDTWSGLNTTHEYDNPPMWELEGYYTVPLWVSPVYSYSLSRTLAGIFTGYHSINDANNDVFSTVAVQALSNSLNGSSNDPATLSLFLDEVAVSISNKYGTLPPKHALRQILSLTHSFIQPSQWNGWYVNSRLRIQR
jgi:hypothetical protein